MSPLGTLMHIRFEYHSEPVSLSFVLPISPTQRWFTGLLGQEMGSRTGRGGRGLGSTASPLAPLERCCRCSGGRGLPALGYNFGLRHNKIPLFRAVKKVRCCWVFFFCLGCFFRGIKGVCTLCKCILRILSPCQEQVLQNVWVPCVVINPVLSLK